MVGGVAVGQYTGLYLMLPLGAAAAAWWASRKLLPESRRLLAPAFSAQAGHGMWLAMGLMVLGSLNANALDPVLLIIGLAWLVAKPGNGPLYFLAALQSLSLVLNALTFMAEDAGTPAHKALLVHLIFRITSLGLLAQLWVELRRRASIPESGSP